MFENHIDKQTLFPSSWAIAKARAVFPVPGGPANKTARPAMRLDLIKSTTNPAALKQILDMIMIK